RRSQESGWCATKRRDSRERRRRLRRSDAPVAEPARRAFRLLRHGRMIRDIRAPRMLGADVDADSRSPRDWPERDSAVLDEPAAADEIEPILRERDPHRQRQVAGTAAQN